MRIVYKLIMPGGPIVLGVCLVVYSFAMPEAAPEFARFIPSAIFVIGALLGARFHSSLMVLALIVLALADWGLYFFSPAEGVSTDLSRDVLTGIAFLLPLNFAVLSLGRCRGVLTPSTLSRLGLIVCQPVLVAVIHLNWPGEIASTLDLSWLSLSLPETGPLTQPGWVAFAGVMVLLPARYSEAPNALVGGLFWALVAVLLALNADPTGLEMVLYLCTAGCVLIVSQIESSYLLVFRDELTELPARRALNQALLTLGKRYTIAMVDIDHFKKFNDTYGHDVGDQLLRMIGFKLAALTGGGTAFRYGGEEFTLLFPGKHIDDAMPHIETIFRAIRNTPFTIRAPGPRHPPGKSEPKPEGRDRQKVRVTVSIGVAAARTPNEVVTDADGALYRAKAAGRNQIAR